MPPPTEIRRLWCTSCGFIFECLFFFPSVNGRREFETGRSTCGRCGGHNTRPFEPNRYHIIQPAELGLGETK